jgi:hypothetical protein
MIKKYIVIDFDRTIGYFYQFNIVCQYFLNRHPAYLDNPHELISHMECIFRPGIFKIFTMIIYARNKHIIDKFILYTKNDNKMIINMVTNYIRHKLTPYLRFQNVFDTVLYCEKNQYKNIGEIVQDQIDNDKNLNIKKQICVMDDKVYDKMIKDNVFYIHCVPYVHELTCDRLVRIINELSIDIEEDDLVDFFEIHNKKIIDKKLTRKNYINLTSNIIHFLQTFINYNF